MIHRTARLEQFEVEYARERIGAMSFEEALAVFEGLWAEARALNPDFPTDWRDDLEPDLRVARAVNGLPPGP
jgi:hypothetical protein